MAANFQLFILIYFLHPLVIILSPISRALMTFKGSLAWQIKVQDLTVSVICLPWLCAIYFWLKTQFERQFRGQSGRQWAKIRLTCCSLQLLEYSKSRVFFWAMNFFFVNYEFSTRNIWHTAMVAISPKQQDSEF